MRYDLVVLSRHVLSYMPKTTCILFHLAVLCDSLRCGAYCTFCYGISERKYYRYRCSVLTMNVHKVLPDDAKKDRIIRLLTQADGQDCKRRCKLTPGLLERNNKAF